MLICHCFCLTCQEILRTDNACGAGTKCGGCLIAVEELLQQKKKDSEEVECGENGNQNGAETK